MKITVYEGLEGWEKEFVIPPRIGEYIIMDECYLKVKSVAHGDHEIFIETECAHLNVYKKDLIENLSDEYCVSFKCTRCKKITNSYPHYAITGTTSTDDVFKINIVGEKDEPTKSV